MDGVRGASIGYWGATLVSVRFAECERRAEAEEDMEIWRSLDASSLVASAAVRIIDQGRISDSRALAKGQHQSRVILHTRHPWPASQ
jgi:hypothetical protein